MVLTVNANQRDHLRDAGVERFKRRLHGHLRDACSELTRRMDDPALEALIEAVMENAVGHGFKRELDLVRIAEMAVVLGSGFLDDAKYPWALSAARGRGMHAETRMRLLDEGYAGHRAEAAGEAS